VTGEHRDLLDPYLGKALRGAIVRGETIGNSPLQDARKKVLDSESRDWADQYPLRQLELSWEATNRVAGAVGGTDAAERPPGFVARGGVPDILVSALLLDPRPDSIGFVRNVMKVTLAGVDRDGDRAERCALPGERCTVPRTSSE
jgi:hypothetical protein